MTLRPSMALAPAQYRRRMRDALQSLPATVGYVRLEGVFRVRCQRCAYIKDVSEKVTREEKATLWDHFEGHYDVGDVRVKIVEAPGL